MCAIQWPQGLQFLRWDWVHEKPSFNMVQHMVSTVFIMCTQQSCLLHLASWSITAGALHYTTVIFITCPMSTSVMLCFVSDALIVLASWLFCKLVQLSVSLTLTVPMIQHQVRANQHQVIGEPTPSYRVNQHQVIGWTNTRLLVNQHQFRVNQHQVAAL